MHTFSVRESVRLDAFLVSQLEDVSRARVQKMIEGGLVEVNGSVIMKASHKLAEGYKVTVTGELEAPVDTSIEPTDLGLEILFEDEACIVINKPAGYAVHPGSGMDINERTILHGIAHLFSERSLPFSADGILVHRLDKDTTGCLLIAKNSESHSKLQKQFEERSVTKKYLALVSGIPSPTQAVIDAPIGRNLTDRTRMSILKTSVSREAKTTYRTLETKDDCALLECDLHTGRTHQVRVHLSSIGHPILGDETYTSGASIQSTKEHEIEGMCLHSWKLWFVSPDSGEQQITAELPQKFVDALNGIGFSSVG